MRRYLIPLLALALVTGCAAKPEVEAKPASEAAFPSDIDTEPAEPVDTPEPIPTGGVGDGIKISTDDGAGEITLTKVRDVKPGQYDTKAKNGRYLEIVVTVLSTSGTFQINPYDFALMSEDGTEYDSTCCTGNVGEALHDRKLRLGQKAKGSLLYDAPKGPLQLAYRGGGFGSEDLAVWNIE